MDIETCKNAEVAVSNKCYLRCKLNHSPCKFQRYCNLKQEPIQTSLAQKACGNYKK